MPSKMPRGTAIVLYCRSILGSPKGKSRKDGSQSILYHAIDSEGILKGSSIVGL
jgi:hypothetical protein